MPRGQSRTLRAHRFSKRYQGHGVSAIASESRMSNLGGTQPLVSNVPGASIPPNNRFEILSLETSTPSREVENYHKSQRTMNNRRHWRTNTKAKAMKRRRSAKRDNNKHASRMLNERLSQDMDMILTSALATDTRPVLVSGAETNYVPTQSTNYSTSLGADDWSNALPSESTNSSQGQLSQISAGQNVLPTTYSLPQTSTFQFSKLEFKPSTEPWSSASLSTPVKPRLSPTYTFPDWCPISVFGPHQTWSNNPPVFFDLSGIPELKPMPEAKTRSDQLQLWRDISFKPRKKSRFFPSSIPSCSEAKPQSDLLSKYHENEDLTDHSQNDSTAPDISDGQRLDNERNRESQATTATKTEDAHALAKTAATLWSILETHYQAERAHREACNHAPISSNADLNYEVTSEVPVEIDGKELPYVHPNSLTGTSNYIGMSQFVDVYPSPMDSAIVLHPTDDVGLNEMMVDQDIVEARLWTESSLEPLKSSIEEQVDSMDDNACSFSQPFSGVTVDVAIGDREHVVPLPIDHALNAESWEISTLHDDTTQLDAQNSEEENEWMVCTIHEAVPAEPMRHQEQCEDSDQDWETKWLEYCEDGYGLQKITESVGDWDWDWA